MSALPLQLLGLLLLLVGQAWIAAQARSFPVWAAASGLGIALWGVSFAPPLWWLAFLPWAAAAAVWGVPGLWGVVQRRAFARARRGMAPLSATERDALEAGVAGWERALFSPVRDLREQLRGAAAELSGAERAFLDGPVERLCALLDDWDITSASMDLPDAAWQLIRREGFFGMTLPVEFGGLGFSARAHSEVVMKIASRSIAAAVTVMVPNSLGPGRLLLAYGTEEQKRRYLPALARGEEIPCFGLTGPQAGSDAAALPDRGVVFRRDDGGLGVRLDWEKRYITLAPVATLLGLAVRLSDPDGLLGPRRDLGITLVLVPADTPGVEIGRRHLPLQVPFPNGPTVGRAVEVGMEQVIGGEDGIGRGWRMLMECLGEGRAVSLPALATAAAKFAVRETGAYAAIRRQFALPIARFEGVQELLAVIGGNAWLMDAVRIEIARLEDAGACSSVASAIAKQQLTEQMRRVVSAAMDLHAGAGICVGPRNRLARIYQAVPIAITVEGSNVLTRNLIIFGQGLARCHPHLLDALYSLQEADADAAQQGFARAFRAHAAQALQGACASLAMGWLGGAAGIARGGAHAYRGVVFAWLVDALLFGYGGGLKRRERLSGRLADMLSAQYLAVCAARRYDALGRPESMQAFHDWAQCACARQFDRARAELIANVDARPLRWLLRATTWTWRRAGGSDRLDREVAEAIARSGDARARLCAGLYAEPQGRAAQLEEALADSEELEDARRAVREAWRAHADGDADPYAVARAASAISAEQEQSLRAADARAAELIAVDAFAASSLARAPLVVDDG